jgi:hypothetical protein
MSTIPGSYFLKHPQPGVAYNHQRPRFRVGTSAHPFPIAHFPRGSHVATEVAHGGQSVVVGTPDGSHFLIQLTQFIPPPGEGVTSTSSTSSNVPGSQNLIQGQQPGGGAVQPIGTVRAYAMPGGRVGLILDGTTTQSELDISPYPFKQRKGYAHSFAYGQTTQSHILNIGQITVNSGEISAILGYHTADLSGPLVVQGTTPVDRIAFQDLLPGAAIFTGGDLNTLDVLNSVNLNSGPGIFVGRDLNLLNVGQDINLSNGASIFVGRFLGTAPQPPKGTATGSNFLAINQALLGTGTAISVPSLSGYVQGNINIGPGSTFTALNGIANSSIVNSSTGITGAPTVFLVNGTVTVSSPALHDQLISPIANPFIFSNQITPQQGQPAPNFVARSGFIPPVP